MKRYERLYLALFLLPFLIALSGCKTSEETIARVNQVMDMDEFVFEAQSATPQGRGKTINLSSHYSVKVSKDTINAYLPYFGVAYTAPFPGEDGGIKFVSTNFNYQKTDKNKGMWKINIDAQDTRKNYKLIFEISESGYGTLHIYEKDRQPISFYGRIE